MTVGFLLSIICGALMILFAILKYNDLKNKNPYKVSIVQVWLFGILSFLFGILGSPIVLIKALELLEDVGDIPPEIVAGGIKETILKVTLGFCFLILSVVFSIILGKKRKSKMNDMQNF